MAGRHELHEGFLVADFWGDSGDFGKVAEPVRFGDLLQEREDFLVKRPYQSWHGAAAEFRENTENFGWGEHLLAQTTDDGTVKPRDAARRARRRDSPILKATSSPLEAPQYSAQDFSKRAVRRTANFSWKSRLIQAGSMLTAAGALVLAALVPAGIAEPFTSSTTVVPTLTRNNGVAAPAPVSARKDATVRFDRASGASESDPDGKLRDVLKVSAGKVTPTQAKGILKPPLDHLQGTSPFGYRVNPLTGAAGEMHTGQDFAAACGTRVYAAAGGTVRFAGWHNFGGGERVEIDHGNGLVTSYNHNSVLKVEKGQKVKRGDLVALSGSTGASTACHQHFEVLVNEKPVDPMGWL